MQDHQVPQCPIICRNVNKDCTSSCWKEFYYKLNKLNVNYTDESIESMIYDGLDDMKKGILKFKSQSSSRLVFYKNDKSDSEFLYSVMSQLLVIREQHFLHSYYLTIVYLIFMYFKFSLLMRRMLKLCVINMTSLYVKIH